MTSPEAGGYGVVDIVGELAAVGMAAGPVENSRRLIPLVPETDGQVLEFYSSRAAARLLALPRTGADHELYNDLSATGLPMLPRYKHNPSENLDMLQVPLGTKSLGNCLHLIRRDITSYSDLFWYVTRSQVAQYEAGLGVVAPTENLRLVDHFAFAPDLDSETGQRLYLVPPFTVARQGTPLDFARGLITELQTSGEFPNDRHIDYLTDVILQGVAGYDEQ
jgi:hypothetical protein